MLDFQLFSILLILFPDSSLWEKKVNWHLKYGVLTGTKQHIIKTIQRQSCMPSEWQAEQKRVTLLIVMKLGEWI